MAFLFAIFLEVSQRWPITGLGIANLTPPNPIIFQTQTLAWVELIKISPNEKGIEFG